VVFTLGTIGDNSPVPDSVSVEAARIPDRDRLLAELRAAGLEAEAVGEVSIEIPCTEEEHTCAELYERSESLILSIGAPFVPIKHKGVIYIRPPIG
jgi:hypothetical protein